MALTQISTKGIKDSTITTADLANDSVDEAKLAEDSVGAPHLDTIATGSNGQFLKKDNTGAGGITWSDVNTDLVSDTSPQLGGDLDVNDKNIVFGDSSNGTSNDVLKFGAGGDLSIYSDGTKGMIETPAGQNLEFKGGAAGNAIWNRNDSTIVTPGLNVLSVVKLNGQSGTSGQVLTSGGSGSTSWTTVSAAPEVSLVADGAINNNVACNITSAGKVQAVTASAAGANFLASNQDVNNYKAFSYDTEHKLICCFYTDDSDDGLYLKVGSPTGTGTSQTVTWGSSQLLYTDSQAASGGYQGYRYMGACYHPDTKFHVLAWKPAGMWTIAVKINSSGSITTKGSPNHFTGGSGNSVGNVAATLVPTRNSTTKMNVFYKGSSSGTQVKFREVTINTNNGDTTETSEISIMPNGNWSHHSLWHDTTNDNILVAARNGSNGIYFGLLHSGGDNSTQINGAADSRPAICHDPVSNKIVAFYHDPSDGGNNNDLRYMIGTYNSTASSVSWGSEQTAITNNVASDGWNGDMNNYITYDSLNKKFYLAYKQSSPAKVMLLPFTVNSAGDGITTETAIEVYDAGWKTLTPYADSTTGNVYVGMARPASDSSGQGEDEPGIATYYVASTSVTTENFLGWSSAAASDGNTANIKVTGNTVTGLSGLTPGKKYYVQMDGSVGLTPILGKTVEAGVALTSSSLLIR
tara:strand:+ start:2183 stop:4258 length:2076 start_codon:yes stop_codon:yes gene_type:complete